MKATWPELRTAEEELALLRSFMRCYAIQWREHRIGMEKQAEVDLINAKARRDDALKFERGEL